MDAKPAFITPVVQWKACVELYPLLIECANVMQPASASLYLGKFTLTRSILGACADLVYSSNVLEHVTSETGLRKDTAICFAYYDYRDTRLANVTRIITTLIKQLCQRKHNVPDNLLQTMHDARSPSLL